MPDFAATPNDDPPTAEQKRKAIYELVGYRKGRALRITDEALEDGLAHNCLRWYYVTIPTGFKTEGRERKALGYERTLIIERKYLPREQGITTEWNAWCVRWGLASMQVFTPEQKEARRERGEPVYYEDVPDPETPRPFFEEPEHVPGAVGDPADEVEQAIVAAASEYDLNLEAEATAEPLPLEAAPTSVGCEYCSAGPGEKCDVECSCLPCSKSRMMESAAHLVFGKDAPQTGTPHAPAPKREKKFWED